MTIHYGLASVLLRDEICMVDNTLFYSTLQSLDGRPSKVLRWVCQKFTNLGSTIYTRYFWYGNRYTKKAHKLRLIYHSISFLERLEHTTICELTGSGFSRTILHCYLFARSNYCKKSISGTGSSTGTFSLSVHLLYLSTK